jgi:hypothetical protein
VTPGPQLARWDGWLEATIDERFILPISSMSGLLHTYCACVKPEFLSWNTHAILIFLPLIRGIILAMNNLPLVMLQAHAVAFACDADNHPARERYMHLTYWLANRIGVNMEKPTSAVWNIIRKKETLVKVLQLIMDETQEPDTRARAQEALIEIGVIAPPAVQEALPHMPPMPEEQTGEPVEYGKDGDREHYTNI